MVDGTLWGTRVNTGTGTWLPPRAVRRILPVCDRQAVREVAAARQVTLIGPVRGRNEVLWPSSAGSSTRGPTANLDQDGRAAVRLVSPAAAGPTGR